MASARGKPPDLTTFLFFADTKQAKHPIEPKSVPRAMRAYSVWKDTHIFVMVPDDCSLVPVVNVSDSAREWLSPVQHGVAAEHAGAAGSYALHHFTLHYFWSQASARCESERRASVNVCLVGEHGVISLLAFVLEAISPNRTHVVGCVGTDHWLTQRADVLCTVSTPSGLVDHTRIDIAERFGLVFAPRSYVSNARRGEGKADADVVKLGSLSAPFLEGIARMAWGASAPPSAWGLEEELKPIRASRITPTARVHPYAHPRKHEAAQAISPPVPHASSTTPAWSTPSGFASTFPGLSDRSIALGGADQRLGLGSLKDLERSVSGSHFQSLFHRS